MDGRDPKKITVTIYPDGEWCNFPTPCQCFDQIKVGSPDIMAISSDGVSFPLHRGNTLAYSGNFPLPLVTSPNPGYGVVLTSQRRGTITLPEDSEVLKVVFEYFYQKRYPDLEDKPFHLLVAIADAVEKYKIYAAMHPCTSRLR